MAKYCISYEAKNSNIWDADELNVKIAEVLKKNGAFDLQQPVAGTILFEDGAVKSFIRDWNNHLLPLKEDIFYYLCQVAKAREDDYMDRNEGDPNLNDDFQDLLDDLE
jgi:hypothetical protein